MRLFCAVAIAVLLTLEVRGEEVFQDTKLVDARAYSERGGARSRTNMNEVTVQIGEFFITAAYKTTFKNGPNSAGNFIVGQAVQARLDGRREKKLIVRMPGGEEIHADVVRREMASR
jgi:hypothetical protein